jgi:hypothetical protein
MQLLLLSAVELVCSQLQLTLAVMARCNARN